MLTLKWKGYSFILYHRILVLVNITDVMIFLSASMRYLKCYLSSYLYFKRYLPPK